LGEVFGEKSSPKKIRPETDPVAQATSSVTRWRDRP